MLLKRLSLAVVLGWVGVTQAQRPGNASICDYYAQVNYGANTSDTQLRLIEGIVSLAFHGGGNLTNVSDPSLTGILNPSSFAGVAVDLRQFFNGTRASTNLNNQPVGINWLDDGALDPLYTFLSGQSPIVISANTTNQYRLFGHFFIVFGRIFGCSNPPPPLPGDSTTASISLAYVHKFMNLTYNEVGYFIDQMTRSSLHYQFAASDAVSFNSSMNARYNVRCAPAVSTRPGSPPMLFSLCQNPTCPLAAPNADCQAYVNLTADGNTGSANTGTAGLPTNTALTSTVSLNTSPATTTPTTSSTSAAASSGGSSLSGGAIGGIAVGGAAVLGIFILALIFLRRRRRRDDRPPVPSTIGTYDQSPYYGGSPAMAQKDPHVSYGTAGYHGSQQPSEMGANNPQGYYSPGAASPHASSPGWSPGQSPAPEYGQHGIYPIPHQPYQERPPAELAGYEPWGGEHGSGTPRRGTSPGHV